MTDSIRVRHLLGSLGSGGRESLLLDIIENSPGQIHYTVDCFSADPDMQATFEALGAPVTAFDISATSDVRGFIALYHHLIRSDVDILHLHGPRAQVPGRILGRMSGISGIVSTHHGVNTMFPQNVRRYERVTRRFDSVTVAVSNGVRRSFGGENRNGQWQTIHNGIDVEGFQTAVSATDPEQVRNAHDLDDEFVMLNVGRYVPPKNQHGLIEAMRLAIEDLPPAHLFVVGGRGAMEDRLRTAVVDHGLEDHVTITGHVDDIKAYYAAADLFVSSSVQEGLPIVLLEAMAAGLPVVATSIPGVRELIVDGTSGVLVPPRQPKPLRDQLVAMADPDRRERYAQQGFDRVRESFDIQRTVDGYVELYQNLATGGSS